MFGPVLLLFGAEFEKPRVPERTTGFRVHEVCLQVVTNIHSKRKTPLSIGFYKGERLFSTDAESIGTRKPQFVIQSPHTLLGKSFDDPAIAAYIEDNFLPYEVEKSSNGGVSFKLSASEESFPEGRSFTAEELTAMFLSYAKHFSSLFAGGAEIIDTVLTVPAHFTQQNRLALLDAASLAGLRVLSLVDENTAAGVQYGLDKVFANTTHTVLVYNGGASGVQVSVLEYSSYKPKGFGKKRVGQGAVLGTCWASGVGSSALTRVVMDQIADTVNKKHAKALPGDIRSMRRPVAKLFKAARKTKEVLSANANHMLYLESLTPNVDFSNNFMRSDFEEAAADVFAAAMKPVACAMERANRTLAQIDQVEIVGGGVRTPAVQALLIDLLGGNMTLGVHLNGDEAMALGGAFVGANRSTSFRVRPVGMVATLPFAVNAELRNLNEEADTEEEQWSKSSVMFKQNNKLGNLKKLSFKQSKDLSVSLSYTADSPLPEGAQHALGKFAITGIEDAVAKHADLGEPKVSVTFALDHNGIASVLRAEAAFEEWENAADAAEDAAEDAAAAAAAPAGEDAAADEDGEDNTEDSKKDDAAPAGDEEKDAASDATEEKNGEDKDGEEAAEEKEGAEATPTPEPTPLPKPKRKVHRVRLTVTADVSELPVRPLTEEELAASKTVLAELQAVDDERAACAAAKSSLESYIYASRGKMGDLYEELEGVSTEEQRSAITASLEEVEEWLYDEGDDTDVPTYTEKHNGLKDLVQPVLTRVYEATVRGKVTKQAEDFIAATKASLADWNESRPWVSQT